MSLLSFSAAAFEHLTLADLPGRCTYTVAETEADLAELCRLRYRAYRREGIIAPRDDGLFADRYDRDRNAFVLAIRIDGLLIGSIRLHVTGPEHPFGPALDTYADVLGPLLEAGESFVDPSRFVIAARTERPTVLALAVTRLACMAAEHYEADWMLAAVRSEHVPFYRRFCALDVLVPPRPYPGISRPLALLGARNAAIRAAVFARRPVFSSTMAERFALFGPERDLDTRPPVGFGRLSAANGYSSFGSPGAVPFQVIGATTDREVAGEPSMRRVVRAT